MATLVYRYGLLPPTVGAEKVRAILVTAHRYSNTRIEIERGKRAAQREIEARVGLAPLLAAYAEADAWCACGLEAASKYKSERRSRSIPEELREQIGECKRWRAALSAQIREARRTIRQEYGVEYDAINEAASALRRNARGHSGLASAGPHHGAHGTYQIVEEASEKAAADRPLYDPKKGWAPNDPPFRRARGALHVESDGRMRRDAEGSVGVQIHGGMLASELATSSQLQILPRTRAGTRPDSRRGRQGRTLCMRVGSTDAGGREGIYAEWPMIMHRPLPEGARIMNARVHVRRVGLRDEWHVTLTVRVEEVRAPAARSRAVAVNFGWRRVPLGVRVAAWVGEDGGAGEVVCPPSVLDRLAHASTIRSLRDDLFNLARAWAADIIDALDAPEWLRRQAATLRAWRSTERLRDLAYLWSKRRFLGDEDAFAAAHAWARRDRHLYEYETGERGDALGHRREVYRVVAAHLAGRYETLVHDGVDFAKMKTCPMVEAADDGGMARANMHAAAPGELRGAMVNAFRGSVATPSAVDVTHTCPACGVVEAFDAAIKIWHQCACGARWDQDQAAATELLRRHIAERVSSAPDSKPLSSAAVPEVKEAPRAKSKRMARERAERLAACKEGGKAAE